MATRNSNFLHPSESDDDKSSYTPLYITTIIHGSVSTFLAGVRKVRVLRFLTHKSRGIVCEN